MISISTVGQQPVHQVRIRVGLLGRRPVTGVWIFDVLNGRSSFLEICGELARAAHRYAFITRTVKDFQRDGANALDQVGVIERSETRNHDQRRKAFWPPRGNLVRTATAH